MQYPSGYSDLFVQRLNEIQKNLSLAWLTFIALRDEQVGAVLSSRPPVVIDNTLAVPVDELIKIGKLEPHSSERFIWFVLRGALATLYEAFKGDPIRYEAVKEKDWFMLVASLRHSLSHGIEGEWRKIFCNEESQLRFKRRLDGNSYVLRKELIGTGIKFSAFGGLPTAIDVFHTAIDFARSMVAKGSA